MSGAVKNPARVRAGTLGMRARWGPRRVIHLGDLSAEQREVVVALVDATKAVLLTQNREAAPAIVSPGTAKSEGHGNDRPTL